MSIADALAQPPALPSEPDPIGDLFLKDPLDITEEELPLIVEQLVAANRAEIAAYNEAVAAAAASGTKRSGTRTKKAQAKAKDAALAHLTGFDLTDLDDETENGASK